MKRTVVWFRRDLRVSDHAPLHRAAMRGAVIPVFVLDRALLWHPETSVARVAFMLDCLRSLDQDLRDRGGRLIIRYGDPAEVLPQLVRDSEAEGVYAHIDFERIYGRVRDARVNQALAQADMKIRWFEPPGTTPELMAYPRYRDLWYLHMAQSQLPTPSQVDVPDTLVSEPVPTLADLNMESDGKPIPPGGTDPARDLLQRFYDEKMERYYWQLSYPSAEATTGISPHVKFGAISIRECVQTAQQWDCPDGRTERSRQQLIARLRWGSGFAQRFRYLPQLEVRSLYQVFDEDGWDFNEALYEAWQDGQTGFPIIDAAARCLQETGGWQQLNFRSRAIYASFLSNLAGMDWRYGALHFMRHLIDGDCPIDHYQWAMQAGVTHCADKTWTRIYNPEQTAVDRCDPEGAFIKRWVPEVAHLPPEDLGLPPRLRDYPPPILDYRQARQRRVKQLERQRQQFLDQSNVLPFLARMPESVMPLGSDRHPSEVAWAQAPLPHLFPDPLNLDTLDETQAKALRTWFVAHVDIRPQRPMARRKSRQSNANQDHAGDYLQMNLFGQQSSH
ncbi:FAD-binding domain-containing protein [Vacuolonema iberomarrocanum]|uniref:FAD-binding domain-containing protein n=1 Tax=Vacuolonema iberomarrocanum TaxID=3454632 RepID=UPI0019F4C0EA|nr:deoxyribodipyrimidine photo-lyase [filamentous cyanobacterium LEGE 07170]